MRFPLLAYLFISGAIIAAPEQKTSLLELAKKKFGADKITPSETRLFASTDKGETAIADPNNNLVHAECLRWLCTDREAQARVTYRGLDIEDMTIEGDLDLENAQIPFPIIAEKCQFRGKISLINARIRSLDLANCTAKALDAEALVVEGMMYLQPNFQADWLKLLDATIKGSLECDGATLNNPKGIALDADDVKIEGQVFLRRLKATGELLFLASTIGGNVECDGAEISAKPIALNFDGANIKGSLFLRNNFVSHGEVNLLMATVIGALDCNGAHFDNAAGLAFRGYKLHVEGSAFFGEGFIANGEVELSDANIGGSIYCENAQFNHSVMPDEQVDPSQPLDRYALSLGGTKIDGSVYLRNGFTSRGEVGFGDVTVGGNLVVAYANFSNPTGTALYAENIKVEGNVYFRRNEPTTFDGRVVFFGANIANDFMWLSVQLSPTSFLDLSYAKVAMLEDEPASWPAAGHLIIEGFTYDRIYEESSTSRQRWLGLQLPGTHFQRYYQLASIYRSLERTEDVRDVMIAKNENHAQFTKPYSRDWLWYNLFGRWIGYGYNPRRPFFISLVIILIGTGIFRRARRLKIITATDADVAKAEAANSESNDKDAL